MAKTEKFIDENEVLNTNAFNATNQEADIFVESFWYWKTFSHYVLAMLIMLSVFTVMTFCWMDSPVFVALMGTASSLIEAVLGVPQLRLNWQRKSTKGLSPLLIGMWLWGDGYKLMYYASYNQPI